MKKEDKPTRNWGAIAAVAALLCVATYVMTRNPDHQAEMGARSEAMDNYEEVAEETDTIALAPAEPERRQPSGTRTAPAPQVRDILSEEIPSSR